MLACLTDPAVDALRSSSSGCRTESRSPLEHAPAVWVAFGADRFDAQQYAAHSCPYCGQVQQCLEAISICNCSKVCLPCPVQGSLGTLQTEMTPRATWHGGTRSGRRRCLSSTPGRCHPCRQACNRHINGRRVGNLVCKISVAYAGVAIEPAWPEQMIRLCCAPWQYQSRVFACAAPQSLSTSRAGWLDCRFPCSGAKVFC